MQVVALGGLAAATNFCYSNTIYVPGYNITVNNSNTIVVQEGNQSIQASDIGSCVSAFSLPWW